LSALWPGWKTLPSPGPSWAPCRTDPYYLVYPEGCHESAVDVGLLARYARRGNARLLPASRSTNWDEADWTWERLLIPARISGADTSLGRVPEDTRDLAAVRRLVERLRAEAPRQVDLVYEEVSRQQAEHLAHLLVLTQRLVARVVAA
jgi:hypothetical protein